MVSRNSKIGPKTMTTVIDMNKARATRDAKAAELIERKKAARNGIVDWMETYHDLGSEFLIAEMDQAKEIALAFRDMTRT